MYSEITKATFKIVLLNIDRSLVKERTEQGEHYAKRFFTMPDGQTVMELENYVSGVTQYYVEDINA